jgi:O-succinylbenzoic acid--CoA ligase
VPDAEWGSAVVAVVQATPDRTPDLATIRAAAVYAQGPAAAPKHLVLVPDLPRRGPGKPDRAAIGALARREVAGREPSS